MIKERKKKGINALLSIDDQAEHLYTNPVISKGLPQKKAIKLDANRIDPIIECTYKTLTAQESQKYSGLHCHEYYELFLVTDGSLRHIINGEIDDLTEGDCVFIRPSDEHRFEPIIGSVGQFTNIEISCTTIEALQKFLGDGFKLADLLKISMPPRVHLNTIEKERMKDHLWELNRLPLFDGATIKMRLRALLAYTFTRYFSHQNNEKESYAPEWLQILCFKMGYQPNIAAGVSRMVEISNKSPAYLSRAFKKHFNQSPSEYVNHARLNFAANLLAHTEYKITWIAQESGFLNVSNFYERFFKMFSVTPAEFRKNARK